MSSTALVPKAHADLGASSADRWMACPGSVRLTKGLPNVDTAYTREGTAAHALAEKCLTENLNPGTFIGMQIAGEEVTEDMAEAVEIFVDYVREICQTTDPLGSAIEVRRVWIEKQFNLEKLGPPEPMFGTADVAIYLPSRRRLCIPDYKHGKGYAVDAVGNKQLLYYALGAVLAVEEEIGPGHIDDIELTIVQPRGSHKDGIIRTWIVKYDDVIDFAGELLERAQATQDPNAPLNPGPHCRFCRAIATCPAQLQQAQQIAQLEFAPDGALVLPPAPETLPMGTIVQILEKADLVEKWIKGVRLHAISELQAGRVVPGYKLVEKRPTRKVKDPAEMIAWMEAGGYTPEQYNHAPELKSPAQLEAVILGGKKKKKGQEVLPPNLIIAESSGVNLAPAHDPRPEVVAGPQSDFTALTDGGD